MKANMDSLFSVDRFLYILVSATEKEQNFNKGHTKTGSQSMTARTSLATSTLSWRRPRPRSPRWFSLLPPNWPPEPAYSNQFPLRQSPTRSAQKKKLRVNLQLGGLNNTAAAIACIFVLGHDKTCASKPAVPFLTFYPTRTQRNHQPFRDFSWNLWKMKSPKPKNYPQRPFKKFKVLTF